MPGSQYSKNILPHFYRKASAPACRNCNKNLNKNQSGKGVKGSITVEAALAVPFFFLAIVSLLYLMELSAVRTSVRSGLQSAGKQLMQDACEATIIIPSKLENDIVNEIGGDRLDRSMIKGGRGGIHCEESCLSAVTGTGTLKAKYEVHLPLPVFAVPTITCEESIRIKAWTGYEKHFFGNIKDDTVYITENGIVYHKDYHCTYLELSIRMVSDTEVKALRNSSGGKYYPCEHCGGGAAGGVYITDNGDRYHSTLACSGLKRTVYAVPVSEAAGKGVCSRCGR